METPPRVATFGEIMLRLSPPGLNRFAQARSLDVAFGGGEANVAVCLARWGMPARFVTRLPNNDIGHACVEALRGHGVETGHVVWGGERIGIYFLETGAVARPSKVLYDRAHSALAEIRRGMIDWDTAFAGCDWFHWTGITPAISEGAADACLEAVQTARACGMQISCDLNYRSKLWRWGGNPDDVMSELVSLADVAIGNEEDAERIFGLKAGDTEVTSGEVDPSQYESICNALTERFPNLRLVAITLRGSCSASHNSWSSVLWTDGKLHAARRYEITHIVDRVGAGDSFAAGLIHGLHSHPGEPGKALEFATAASCLKHTVHGDFNLVSLDEVTRLLEGDSSGRVAR